MNEHREAINHDLIKCGLSLENIGGVLNWDSLGDFISKTEPDSALARDIDPEASKWSMNVKTNEILADLYDLIAVFRYEVTAMLSGKKPKKPQLYTRPHKDDKKKIGGKGALPVAELKAWINSKLKGSDDNG